MNNEQANFLKLLAQNEDDNVTRLIYADWLEENNQPEEASRMRKWAASKAWLMEFTKSINYTKYARNSFGQYYDTNERELDDPHSYEDVLEAGKGIASGLGYSFRTDDGADYFLEGEENTREFFRHWSIVTGLPVPEEAIENPYVGCSC